MIKRITWVFVIGSAFMFVGYFSMQGIKQTTQVVQSVMAPVAVRGVSIATSNFERGQPIIYRSEDLSLPAEAKAFPLIALPSGETGWDEEQTYLWIVSDGKTLRVIAYCTDKDKVDAVERTDLPINQNDGVEFFFSDNNDGSQDYYQTMMSSSGRTFAEYYSSVGVPNSIKVDNIVTYIHDIEGAFIYEVKMSIEDISLTDSFYFQFIRNYRGQKYLPGALTFQQFPEGVPMMDADHHDKTAWGRVNLSE
jgi:hypothetical protein